MRVNCAPVTGGGGLASFVPLGFLWQARGPRDGGRSEAAGGRPRRGHARAGEGGLGACDLQGERRRFLSGLV